MSLRLYDELIAKIGTTPVEVNPSRLCTTINRLPETSTEPNPYEIIYVLILHHYYQENQSTRAKTSIPYGGKTFDDGNGVLYTLNNLPPSLVQILAKYIDETINA
jgi:hypothetical protein